MINLKNISRVAALGAFALSISISGYAREVKGSQSGSGRGNTTNPAVEDLRNKAASCLPATAQADLDINNVRARILNGGDMWWDLNSVAKYEIPKLNDPSAIKKNSMFAGAIWIGGLDLGGNLKVAAMTYRQSGSDYFPGPLDTTTASIDANRCRAYDKIWKVNREEIERFYADPTLSTGDITSWPGNGDPLFNEGRILAPFFDANGDGIYDPTNGTEYPILDPERAPEDNQPEDQPDQMLYFIYNDKGNIHSETGGLPIGIEMGTTAFGFSTQDEINNMTFYKTKITNRSSDEVRNCFFGQWVDADLGNYADDYVGCDVSRNLGYCYNGDDDDEGVLGYGLNPPSVGTTFFEGPRDSSGNEIGLSRFVYYNNDFSIIGNPQTAEHFYNYLRGFWKDNTPITFGGNGYGGSTPTNFMFPDDPLDPNGWSERAEKNTPSDRRYLQSAGPFNLKPGAVNYVTVGVVWARTTSGGATGSLRLLRNASDKAQVLFNNRFKIPEGPRSPEVSVQELDQQIILNFAGEDVKAIENFNSQILGPNGDTLNYKFEGYIIYQLADGNVTTGELTNIERARIVAQVDVKNDVGQIINLVTDPVLQVPIPIEMVNGRNQGIQHSFRITEDLFATGNSTLVNHKSYFYLVLSYAHLLNDPSYPEQFLSGRINVKVYRATPHKSDPRNGGSDLGAGYGDGPEITRVEGIGNGGNILELTKESVDEILANGSVAKPKYLGAYGPVRVKVVDPFRVPIADFKLTLNDESRTPGQTRDTLNSTATRWTLVKINPAGQTSEDTIYSDTTIGTLYEQMIIKWGLSVTVDQAINPGDPENIKDQSNGYFGSSIEFADNGRQWFDALEDADITQGVFAYRNWIRAGSNGRGTANFDNMAYEHDFAAGGVPIDPFERYEEPEFDLLINPFAPNGTDQYFNRKVGPYALASRAPYVNIAQATYGPAYSNSNLNIDNTLEDLYSVDIVLTPDRSKWTKCIVFEMSEDPTLSVGNAAKFDLRKSPSLERDLVTPVPGETGRSWFPGYAINVETGERLNMAFGEDSYYPRENGGDMIWNPTSNEFNSDGGTTTISLGGKHFIYVFGNKRFNNANAPTYDEGNFFFNILQLPNNNNKRAVMARAMWVIPALAAPGFDLKSGVPPTEVKIRLRVTRAYGTRTPANQVAQNDGQPMFEFSTGSIAYKQSAEKGKTALDLIRVVPNPYYAYSNYEGSQLDNRVKITNLPPRATIRIYTIGGNLVRTIRKDDPSTAVEWDLKNGSQVPIGSGMYIIHVDAGELGTKIVKWFGIMRQIDLDSF